MEKRYFWCHALDAPLFAMYGMFQFVLVKELQATPFQIALYVSLKPVTALLSSCWSVLHRSRLSDHLLVLALIAALPPLLFPFFPQIPLALVGFGLFFVADRAAMTAWTEIIRQHLPGDRKGWIVSRTQLVLFSVGAFLPLLVAPGMDRGSLQWPWIFFAMGLLSLVRIPLLRSLRVRGERVESSVREMVSILWRRPDFLHFQLIFLFGGLGLMMALAVVPRFVGDLLQLSYLDLALAFAFAKGVGFAVSARLWSRLVHRMDLFLFCSIVAFLAAISVLLIPCSLYWTPWLYLALFLYGVMQGGSGLGWQLSGSVFSRGAASTPYTGINVLSVGARGCFGPSLGSRIALESGALAAFYVSAASCLLGSVSGLIGYLLWGGRGRTTAPLVGS